MDIQAALNKFFSNPDNPVSTKLNAMDKKLNAMDKKLNAMDIRLGNIERDVTTLVAVTPQAAMAKMTIPVAQQGDQEAVVSAINEGARDTWTYAMGTLDGKNCCLAFTAAHCGLCYKIVSPPRLLDKFISMPLEIIELGVNWIGLVEDWCDNFPVGPDDSNNVPRERDILVVCIHKFPDNVDPLKVLPWPNRHTMPGDGLENDRFFSQATVAGQSKAGIVRGNCCAFVQGRHGRYIRYILDSEEPGNSGTAMALLRPDSSEESTNGEMMATRGATFLGPHLGVDLVGGHMKPRGTICPFLHLDRFKKYYLEKSREKPQINLWTGHSGGGIFPKRMTIENYNFVRRTVDSSSIRYYEKATNGKKEYYGIIVTEDPSAAKSPDAKGAKVRGTNDED